MKNKNPWAPAIPFVKSTIMKMKSSKKKATDFFIFKSGKSNRANKYTWNKTDMSI